MRTLRNQWVLFVAPAATGVQKFSLNQYRMPASTGVSATPNFTWRRPLPYTANNPMNSCTGVASRRA